MTTPFRRAIFLVLLAAQGCMYVPPSKGGRGLQIGGDGGRRDNRNRSTLGGFGGKVVHDKREPTRLVARDGTSCVVPKKKFDATVPGTTVWCKWFDADR
jgi:hypothetical protein